MRVATGASLLGLSLFSLVLATPAHPVLAPRAAASSSTTSSSIQDILNLVTTGCNATCNVFVQDLSACAGQSSTAAIAGCACSSQTLGDIRTCAACISADPKTATPAKTSVVKDYNDFVSICISEGLASITGTVSVGESTQTLERTISSTPSGGAKPSTSKPPKNATYTGGLSTVVATDVAGLETGSGSTTSGSGTSSAPAPTTTTGGAGGRTWSVMLGLVGVAGVWALL